MKHTITTILLATACAPAYAGGLADPIVTPPVASSTPAQTDWSGPYVGIFGGQRTVTTQERYSEYQWSCEFGSTHSGRKCAYGGHEDSPEIAALERGTTPWKGFEGGDPVVYDEDQFLMYGAANSSFIYTARSADAPQPVAGKNAINRLDGITIYEIDVIDEAETYGVFAGYRHDFGGLIGGAEAGFSADMQTFDAQIGVPMGNLLAYSFGGVAQSDYGSGYSFGAGADLMLGGGWFVGAQYREATFDGAVVQDVTARIGWAF